MPSIIDTFGKPDRGDMRHATRAAPPAFPTGSPHLHACGAAYDDAGADPGRPVRARDHHARALPLPRRHRLPTGAPPLKTTDRSEPHATDRRRGISFGHRLEGPEGAPVVAFSNSLGVTLDMWDAIAAGARRALSAPCGTTRAVMVARGSATSPPKSPDLARDLAGLLDALGIGRAHLVGLSLGGHDRAGAGQQQIRGRPLSATLMATAAHMPSAQSWDQRAETVRAQGPGALVEATLGRWFTPGFITRTPPEVVQAVRERFLACDPAGYAVCCGAIGRMDLRPVLPAITAPTLVIAGRDDPFDATGNGRSNIRRHRPGRTRGSAASRAPPRRRAPRNRRRRLPSGVP